MRSRRRWFALVALVVAVGAAAVAVPVPSAPAASPTATRHGPPRGMHEVFRDDFDGTSLDPARWATCYPWVAAGAGCTNFGNPELQWYLPSQVKVDDGTLRLVASREPTAGLDRDGNPQEYRWRSGMVTTYPAGPFTYGYVEVRARLPAGDGLWSILWLLPYDMSWPPEVDIAELYGEDPTALTVVLHGERGVHPYTVVETPDLSRRFHTFGLRWEPASLRWYVDGRVVYRYSGDGIPSTPMYFLASLAVGNFLTAHPTTSTPDRASMDIRRVVLYQR